ncbi:hypothetical protein LIER_21995 [Lithospermum erythrorhizon]|uniref:Uncharacterized protein n=1 Tax=Lithospermum erythrorhizon TaxID=34254 RepID=A0AAV3QVE1_LITER
MVARYMPLKDPLVAFPQSAKHMTEASNGTFILARRADRLAYANHTATQKIEVLKKVISTKNLLLAGVKGELYAKKTKCEGLCMTLDERNQKVDSVLEELRKEKDADAEKA